MPCGFLHVFLLGVGFLPRFFDRGINSGVPCLLLLTEYVRDLGVDYVVMGSGGEYAPCRKMGGGRKVSLSCAVRVWGFVGAAWSASVYMYIYTLFCNIHDDPTYKKGKI